MLAAAGALGAPRIALGQATPDKHLIVVYLEGGWDVTFCLDPKLSCSQGGTCAVEGPEADEDPSNPQDREAVETFGNLPIVVNRFKRPSTRAFFETWHERCHVVNGIWTGSIAHVPCRYRMLTGLPDGRSPDMATIAGYVHGKALPLGAVDLSGWSIVGDLASSTGRIGYRSQLTSLVDGGPVLRAPDALDYDYPLFTMADPDEDAVEAFVRARAQRMRERFADGGGRNDRALDDLLTSLDRGDRFRAESASILSSLQIGTQASFSSQIDIALDLVEHGLCHAVTIDSREAWDTHDLNVQQHDMYERVFRGLGGLMRDLEERGLLDRVVVAVVSEMTRTPQRNQALGKDHWAHTSALLMGAVRGDAVSGATDDLVESVEVDLETGAPDAGGQLNKYDNFCAGLLELVGVDPGEWLPGVVPFRGARPT